VNLSAPLALRRAAALILLLMPAVLLWLLAVDPLLRRYSETQDAMERSLQLLARYKVNAAQKPDLEQRVLQRRKASPHHQGLIEAPSSALATSALQSGLRRILDTNGGTVRVISVAPPVREQGYDRLTARAEIGVSADRLIDVVYALESSVTPNLTIEALDIRAPDHTGQGQKLEENVSLTVRLDVSGFWEPR
jgi:hypothetical protein